MRVEDSLEVVAPGEPLDRWREAIATDLCELAVLHDCELDADLVDALHSASFPRGLGLRLDGGPGRDAVDLLAAGLQALPLRPDQRTLDDLAADYAAIYLTYNLRASPFESVWTDPEALTLQESTFQVRDWYRRYGLVAEDWRLRADDHLVCQLQFVAHLLRVDEGQDEALSAAARFLDEHLLRWVDGFAMRVVSRCATPFYAGLASLTAAYLHEFRDLLARLTREPRPTAEEIEERMCPKTALAVDVPVPHVPGAGPSW